MNTTPEGESTEQTFPSPSEASDDLDVLAASDPAEAPEIAERLAHELAGELEGAGIEAEPEQLTAGFDTAREDAT